MTRGFFDRKSMTKRSKMKEKKTMDKGSAQMKKLKVGIIGCGGIAHIHLQALQAMMDVEIESVCDVAPKVMTWAEALGSKGYRDYHEMLEDEALDAVHICTPHYLHHEMAMEALKKGKHVFLEKPMGMTVRECEILAEYANKSNQKVGICLQNRLNHTSVAMKEWINKGSLGKIKGIRGFVSWHRTPEYYQESNWRGKKVYEGGGLLMNQMIHTLDLMQWYCGGVEAVSGHVSTRVLKEVIDEEDTGEATLWMKNGAIGHFYGTNTYTNNASVCIEIDCEKGILREQDGRLSLIQEDDETLIAENKKASGEKDYWGHSHALAIRKFYEAIVGLNDSYIKVEEGINSVKIVRGIYESSTVESKVVLD